jgi:hypothetical protein
MPRRAKSILATLVLSGLGSRDSRVSISNMEETNSTVGRPAWVFRFAPSFFQALLAQVFVRHASHLEPLSAQAVEAAISRALTSGHVPNTLAPPVTPSFDLTLRRGERWSIKSHSSYGKPSNLVQVKKLCEFSPRTWEPCCRRDVRAPQISSDGPSSLVRDLQQPLGLVNAVRRASLSLLQGESGVEGWLSLLNGFEAAGLGLSPRWRQSVLLAPLGAAGTADLLERLTPRLLADDGALLRELLSAALTLEVWPNLQFLSVAARVARRPSEIPVLLYQEPVPNLAAWSPLIAWLVPRLASLPEQCRDESAQAMLLWQRSTPPGAPYRKEIGSQAAQWLVTLDELRLRRWSADDDEEADL